MLKSFKIILFYLICFGVLCIAPAQEQEKYKEVILDGKPARLNLSTGEVTLVKPQKPEDSQVIEKPTIQVDTVIADTTKYHTVKEGENLLDISRLYDISLNKLKELNGLETTLVYEGQVLLVFQPESEKNKKPEVNNSKTITNNDTLNSNNNTHIVKKGETLYSISKSYGLTVEELKRNNKLNSNLIKIGQELNVINQSNNRELSASSVIIKKGDTLYSLAKRYNTTVEELKRLNGLENNLILVGQTLRLK